VFVDMLLELTAEWRRVLAPHGSLCVELGDKYSGSGGAGGDYNADGLREGQEKFGSVAGRNGWPMAKSLSLVPELYRIALAYGHNPLTGAQSPAGRWRVRNVVRWVRPNPPVGALGDKFRPATSDLVIACTAGDRWFDLDAVRTEAKTGDRVMWQSTVAPTSDRKNVQKGDGDGGYRTNNPAGAPPLDWWQIVTKGYKGSHYATFPPELCVRPIEAMCPRRVCRTCGKPSRRETGDATYEQSPNAHASGRDDGDVAAKKWASGIAEGKGAHSNMGDGGVVRTAPTTGWSSCGCPGTDGIRLDGYHTGDGWRPGLVLDPFAGTFTTGQVALEHGRDALGIDFDERNVRLARQRVGAALIITYTKRGTMTEKLINRWRKAIETKGPDASETVLADVSACLAALGRRAALDQPNDPAAALTAQGITAGMAAVCLECAERSVPAER
jgi:hypothetical protein